MLTFLDVNDNPVYQDVPDHLWTRGFCSIFANALSQRFYGELYALVEQANDGDETLVHAVLLVGRIVYDADGKEEVNKFLARYEQPGLRLDKGAKKAYALDLMLEWYYGCEITSLVFAPTTVERLEEIHDVEVRATKAAHEYIDRNAHLFQSLKTKRNSGEFYAFGVVPQK